MRTRDWVIAVSLADLCLLEVWAALQDRTQFYLRKVPPSYGEVAAAALDVLLLAVVFVALFRLASSIRKPAAQAAARIALILILMVPYYNVRIQVPALSIKPIRLLLGPAGVAVTGLVMLAAIVLWNRQLAKFAAMLLIIFSPLFAVNVVGALHLAYSLDGAPYADHRAPSIEHSKSPKTRVLVVIFDEFDYQIAFAERPSWLSMPELDRLRSQSVFALHAEPAEGETVRSIPAMLTGLEVSAASSDRSDELVLRSGPSSVPWSAVPNLFSEAHQAGFRTAVVGWYHPYCRVLGRSLDTCFCEGGVSDRPDWSRPVPIPTMMWLDFRRQLAHLPFLQKLDDTKDVARPEHAREYRSIHRRALQLAADASYGLVYLHYPIPHPPGIFNPREDRIDPGTAGGYVDNIPLVDRTLGQLRARMERAATWNSTAVIITSDHPLRAHYWPDEEAVWGSVAHPFVPFLVKLKGETTGTGYGPTFNARILADLALALLDGGLNTPQELVAWLDGTRIHSQIGNSRGSPKGPGAARTTEREHAERLPFM